MPVYQEMDQDLLREILEQYKDQDILTGEKKKEDAYLRQFPCPRCGGSTQPHFPGVQRVFSPKEPLPQMDLKCLSCDAVFNPRNGVISRLGNPGKAIEQAYAQQTPWIRTDDEG